MKKACLLPVALMTLSVIGCKSVKETPPTWRDHFTTTSIRSAGTITPSDTAGTFHHIFLGEEGMVYETLDNEGTLVGGGNFTPGTEAPYYFNPATGNGYDIAGNNESGRRLIKFNPDMSRAWNVPLPDLSVLDTRIWRPKFRFSHDGSLVALLIDRILVTYNGQGDMLGYRELEDGPHGLSPSLLGVNENNQVVTSTNDINVFNQQLDVLYTHEKPFNGGTDVAVVTDREFLVSQENSMNAYSLVSGELSWSTGYVGYIYETVLYDGLYIVSLDPDNDSRMVLSKYSLEGAELWKARFPGHLDYEPTLKMSDGKLIVSNELVSFTIPVPSDFIAQTQKTALMTRVYDTDGNQLHSVTLDPVTLFQDCGAFGCSAEGRNGGAERLFGSLVSGDYLILLSDFDSADGGVGDHAELGGSHFDLSGYLRTSE